MFLRISALLTTIIVSASTLASQQLETDNYLAWKLKLPDSRDAINNFIHEKMEKVLEQTRSKNKTYSCEDITLKIAKQFKTTPIGKSIESFIEVNLSDHIRPAPLDESVLRNTRFYLRYSGLAPTLQINGIYFGADKLSHFASTGRRYYKHYLKKLRRGYSEEEAVKSAIRYGLLNEATVLGWWASGVFSYGDMEANYQGFLFYKRLCLDENDPYLIQDENGKWHIKIKPDLKDYVNPYWDETFNRSYYSPGSWKQVKENLKESYCVLKLNSIVEERISYYNSLNHTSFSLEYIRELQSEGYKRAPLPLVHQDITNLCEEESVTSEEPQEDVQEEHEPHIEA